LSQFTAKYRNRGGGERIQHAKGSKFYYQLLREKEVWNEIRKAGGLSPKTLKKKKRRGRNAREWDGDAGKKSSCPYIGLGPNSRKISALSRGERERRKKVDSQGGLEKNL